MSDCPPRVKLLALVDAGEDVPHLRECEDCANFVAQALDAVKTFSDQSDAEAAVREIIDEIVAENPRHRWGSAIYGETMLHRSVVVRDLLRRADELYGSDPRAALQFSETAVRICDAMAAAGHPTAPELRMDALKEHSTMLRRCGSLDEALSVLGRAWVISSLSNRREMYRAILALCAAIIYAEPDVANFDEAIRLASEAAAVLDVCGDERRCLIARHTEAYALVQKGRFDSAAVLLQGIVGEITEAGGTKRDAALAHALLAQALLNLSSFGESIDHARIAQHLHDEGGDIIDAARAAHVAARALAYLGHIAEVRDEFARTADVVFASGMFDVWCLMRLDYISAALEDDEGADVRADVELVARVAATMAKDSTQRRRFIAEACEYLRRITIRDALTLELAKHVRSYVERNISHRPVKFTPPSGAAFVM
jgi:tetratricopeptide (TPR) repeat protein